MSLLGDGNVGPHCVAFQSEASNLNSADRDKTSDIFVRDLARGRTILVSRGIGAAATNPADRRALPAPSASRPAGASYLAQVGGSVRRWAAAATSTSRSTAQAVTWVAGGKVKLRRAGRTSTVGPGANPTVSDLTSSARGRATSGA